MKFRELIRVAVLFVVLVAVGLLAVFAVRAIRDLRQQTVVFADGSRFILLGTAIGGQRFTTEMPWHKYARRWLPRQWQSWLPNAFTAGSDASATNRLSLWFNVVDANGANLTSLPWSRYEAVGKDGFHYPKGGGYSASSSTKLTLYCISLDAFPRRQSEFELSFLGRNNETIGTVSLRNPVRGPFPHWTPERLPITRTNGPVTLTLEGLIERSNRHSTWVQPKWKLDTTDPRWRGAKPGYIEFSDATGNRGGQLSYQERVWKLSLPLRRTKPKDYSEEEKFLVSALSTPKPDTFQTLEKEFERLGMKISVICLAGMGTLSVTNGKDYGMIQSSRSAGWSTSDDGRTKIEQWGSSSPFFLIETSKPDPLDELRFRLIGSDGKEIALDASGWYGAPDGGRKYQQKFEVTNDISSMSLEVIVSRARLFEFMIDPAEVKRAKPRM